MKVLTFSSRPQTACFHVVNKKRTAVINRKLPKYADESSCHASHTMNFAVVFPQHSCSVRSLLYQVGLMWALPTGTGSLGLCCSSWWNRCGILTSSSADFFIVMAASEHKSWGAHGWVAVHAILPFPCLVWVLTFTHWFLAWHLPAIVNGCLHEKDSKTDI